MKKRDQIQSRYLLFDLTKESDGYKVPISVYTFEDVLLVINTARIDGIKDLRKDESVEDQGFQFGVIPNFDGLVVRIRL